MKYSVKDALTRQFDIIPIDRLGMKITIVGAGAVGGWTAITLARMGFLNLTVIDFDKVTVENMNCQPWRIQDIGFPKVDSLQEMIRDFTDCSIEVVNDRFTGKNLQGIVISAVDSMEARRMIWESQRSASHVIDPRMGAEVCALYVMRPGHEKDMISYEKTLYSDSNAVAEPCTRKSTAYCAMPLSGLVAAQVKAIATGQRYSRITQWDIMAGDLKSWPVE